MRKGLLWLGLALILLVVNGLIVHKETILTNGTLLLLDMAPRDPRSLMQGDYMALRYRIAAAIESVIQSRADRDGEAVITLDQDHVAHFVRIHSESETLATGEMLLHYRLRGGRVHVATDAFYFQEGHAHFYSVARYGRFRVSNSGEAVLTGLCDEKFIRLSAPDAPQTTPCLDGR